MSTLAHWAINKKIPFAMVKYKKWYEISASADAVPRFAVNAIAVDSMH